MWENELPLNKTNKMACALSEDSDQPGHLPSLNRVFTACMKKHWVLSYVMSTQWRLWSDWADAQADLSLRWAHSRFVALSWGNSMWIVRMLLFLLPLILNVLIGSAQNERNNLEESVKRRKKKQVKKQKHRKQVKTPKLLKLLISYTDRQTYLISKQQHK